MSDEELIEDARKWIRLHENNKYQREAAKRMRRLTDRLEATIKEMHARELHHFEAEQERAAALAVIEKAREWRDEAYHGEFGADDYAQGYQMARRA